VINNLKNLGDYMYTYKIISDQKSLCWIHNCGVVKDLKPVEDYPQAFLMILQTEMTPTDLNWAFGDYPIIKSLISS